MALLACSGGDAPAPEEPVRDPVSQEEPPAPPAGSTTDDAPEDVRIVVLGTSLTAGLGLDDPVRESWPARLQARADAAGLPVRVVNAGVSGDTSAGGLRRLEWVLQEPVDVLVVELGANDGLRGLSLEAMEENLRTIILRTREANPSVEVVLAGMEAPTNLGPAYTEGFRDVFLRLSREMDVALVPFLLEGVAAVEELNQADGIHPTARGHGIMAENAWPRVEAAILEAIAEQQVGEPGS